MRKFTLLCLLIALVACQDDYSTLGNGIVQANSHQITRARAVQNAMDFLADFNANTRSAVRVRVSDVTAFVPNAAQTRGINAALATLLYIINFADSAGFVIAGADDRYDEIVAYIDDGNYHGEGVDNPGFALFLDSYLSRLYAANVTSGDDDNPNEDGEGRITTDETDPDDDGDGSVGGGNTYIAPSVAPKLVVKWGQKSPWNAYNSDTILYPYTGCVPTAVSQVCSFLEQPTQVSWLAGNRTGSASLNWTAIKRYAYCNDSTIIRPSEVSQVAHLMRFWGIKLGAEYSSHGTSAQTSNAVEKMQELGFNTAVR